MLRSWVCQTGSPSRTFGQMPGHFSTTATSLFFLLSVTLGRAPLLKQCTSVGRSSRRAWGESRRSSETAAQAFWCRRRTPRLWRRRSTEWPKVLSCARGSEGQRGNGPHRRSSRAKWPRAKENSIGGLRGSERGFARQSSPTASPAFAQACFQRPCPASAPATRHSIQRQTEKRPSVTGSTCRRRVDGSQPCRHTVSRPAYRPDH